MSLEYLLRCPISYEPIPPGSIYSHKGLKALNPQLKNLNILAYSAVEQRKLAMELADKLSIQGVQPKLSINLSVKENCFKIVTQNGAYILKPQVELFPELPQNEDVSMRLAKTFGIEVPLHGLIYCSDGSLSYFIKRFDRVGRQKRSLEDFSQLMQHSREKKYASSMEKLSLIIDKYCTFPAIEKYKLLKRILFNFLIGNEDMHLKNYSLITMPNLIQLAPAYDFLNSTIASKSPKEEIALSINGKKNNLTKKDLIDYYAYERLGLNKKQVDGILDELNYLTLESGAWETLISISFLSNEMKNNYLEILKKRTDIIFNRKSG